MKKRILILEDERSLQTVLMRLLKKRLDSVDITWATDGIEALEHLRGGAFDLVIADYTLPGELTGLQFWDVACADRTCACATCAGKTPFLLMSSLSTPEFLHVATECRDVPPYLRKPFTSREFLSAVEALIGSDSVHGEKKAA